MRWIFGISLPLAVVGMAVFPFHLRSFVLIVVGGAIYALPYVIKGRWRTSSDAARFLSVVIGGALCLFAAGSFPKFERYSSYYVFAAFAIAAVIGSGAALIFQAKIGQTLRGLLRRSEKRDPG